MPTDGREYNSVVDGAGELLPDGSSICNYTISIKRTKTYHLSGILGAGGGWDPNVGIGESKGVQGPEDLTPNDQQSTRNPDNGERQ